MDSVEPLEYLFEALFAHLLELGGYVVAYFVFVVAVVADGMSDNFVLFVVWTSFSPAHYNSHPASPCTSSLVSSNS